MDLRVAIEHSHYRDVAATFTKVTRRSARFNIDMETYFRE